MNKIWLILTLSLTVGCNACAPAAEDVRISSGAHGEAAGVRFLEVITGGASASDKLPLVVVIHGLGGRPEAILKRAGILSIPARARVIAPYGFEPHEGGYSWLPEFSGDDAFAESSRRAADRLAAMIGDLAKSRPTTGKPVVTGFSQGGILSFTIAVTHPEAVRAAFPVSGLLARGLWPSAWPADKDKPVIHAFHGTADPIVPIFADRASVLRLAEIGLDADLREYAGEGHIVGEDARRDLVKAIARAIAP